MVHLTSYPSIKHISIVTALLLLAVTSVRASENAHLQERAGELQLANHPIWLKLLHYDHREVQSAILDEDFFLSPIGRNNPSDELTATIEAYYKPWGENPDAHAQCQFPARYYWLSTRLDLPGYTFNNEKCEKLKNWSLYRNVKSLSFIMVSGFLGNPASTFGHSMIKLNTDSPDDKLGFYDTTVNYGALTPRGENPFLYAFKGLFGGYKASFSDKYFYLQDLVYTRTELRDMWNFTLALTDYQRTLLIFHIWEIAGKKFIYYFLDKNCGYRLAELLELVTDENFVRHVDVWYAPEDMFHKLTEINQGRIKAGKPKIIESVKYIPSSRRKLYHQLELLSNEELEVFNATVEGGMEKMESHLSMLDADGQILLLDSLLAFQQYKLIKEGSDATRNRKEIKNQLLLARLKLPAKKRRKVFIPELKSPAEGSRPLTIGLQYASDRKGDGFMRLTWSPFKKENVGQNSLEGNEFATFDLAIGLLEDGNEIFFDQFDLIRVINLNTFAVPIAEENRLSWTMRIGVSRIEEGDSIVYDAIGSYGSGKAVKWNEHFTGYVMLEAAGHGRTPHARLRPHVGLVSGFNKLRIWLYGGGINKDYDFRMKEVWGGKVQYQITDRQAFIVEANNEKATRFTAGINWYF